MPCRAPRTPPRPEPAATVPNLLRVGPPPYAATRRGSAAAVRRARGRPCHRDLILQLLVQLVADALHVAQVLGPAERVGAPVRDDGLSLRRPDAGELRQLLHARGVEIDPRAGVRSTRRVHVVGEREPD